MMKIKITPDSELATKEAIEFRLKSLQSDMSASAAKRKEYLKTRLGIKPAKIEATNGIVPTFNPVLLASKKDMLSGYGDTRSMVFVR